MVQVQEKNRGGYLTALNSQHAQLVISGMSGKMPNSNNVHEFMEKLYRKENLCSEDTRRQVFSNPEIPKESGKLYDLEKFDNGYFGFHSYHAKYTCPMIRIVLEQVVSALMDAGIHPDELIGTRTGVFIGACASDFELLMYQEKSRNTNLMPGTTRSMIAQRISYFLQLNGPSYICDTACSSSMYALENAYRAVLEGRCERAIVGGTHLIISSLLTLQFARLGVLNAGTGCRPFDNDASGYTRAEAIIVIILQKRSEAKRVYAELVHIKSNTDGYKSQGITFPSFDGQIDVLNETFKEANIHPLQLGYVEAHGTGTIVGDPEELSVIESFFKSTVEEPLLIGSVKGNMGHCEASSGLCSMVKVSAALNNGKLAPNINYKTPREGIRSLVDGRLKVVTEITPFPGGKELAGVNCFGFGGANVHAILRRHNECQSTNLYNCNGWTTHARLVCYSGRNKQAIQLLQENVQSNKDVEFLGLIQEAFKTPIGNHLFRGFSIVGTTVTSCKPVEFRKRKDLIVVFGKYSTGSHVNNLLEIPLVHKIHQELKNFQTFNNEILTYTIMIKTLVALSLRPTVFQNSTSSQMEHVVTNDIIAFFKSKHFKNYQSHQASSVAKNSTIVVLGDAVQLPTKCKVIHFSNEMSSNKFLWNIGRLYEEGFNPEISKLYEPIKYPVSRGTDMISHLIGWASTTFVTPIFGKLKYPGTEKIESLKCHEKPEVAFYRGHLIDNRNLFPATGYLWLIWELFADYRDTHPDLMNVFFQNVRFHRACTITAKALDLYLVIHPSGEFEVSENNTLIVSGSIFAARSAEHNLLEQEQGKADDKLYEMHSKDIYKELRLRGYNYRGLFRALDKVSATSATIKWYNWVTFLDNMMQVCILQRDTRSLVVPVGIESITISTREHLENVDENDEKMVKVHFSKNSDVVRSKYVEMRGLYARSIARRKEYLKPVLESYEFVPNVFDTNLKTSIRINMQLLLECKPIVKWPILEILDFNDEFVLSPEICRVLEDLPLIIPSMCIRTENEDFQLENATVVKTTSDRYLLLVCKNPDENILIESQKTLVDDGFLLCLCSQKLDFKASSNFIVLTKHSLQETNEVIYFCRKKVVVDNEREIVDVSTLQPTWLTQTQNVLGKGKNIVLLVENLEESGIIGLTNCLLKEPDGEKVQCAFIQDCFTKCNTLMAQLEKQMPINVYQNGQWGTYRHLHLPTSRRVESFHWCAIAVNPGELSSVSWRQGPIKHNYCSEIKPVKVLYAAVNFRDLMLASRKINPDDITHDRLLLELSTGFEFSGIDSNGKRIVGMSTAAMSNYVEKPSVVTEVPECWEMDDAATTFVVYVTVLLAFSKMGSLRKGQSILIHSGAGGIGLSALNIASYYQMNIFVTVGTEEKRAYLLKQYPNLKTSHFGNSRDTSFKEMIRRETNGRGVDIVLNSLAEEKLHASVDCLAFGGHFLEIGKYDMAKNNQLSIDLAVKQCTFQSVVLDEFIASQPTSEMNKLIALFHEGCEKGFVKPLPKTIFNTDELDKAFKYMSTGKHIGKILIRIDHSGINKNVIPYVHCDPKCSYIIFGGLGGFGLELADWLILRGARNLILSSRSGVKTGYQKYRISIWQSYGVNIIISCDDTTTYAKCSQVLKKIHDIAPIDGIFNLAVVLQDAVYKNQTIDSMQASMLSKATLTSHLDKVTREMCPKMTHFVVFSSVSCGRGNAGQTNYGYSNSVMERICERRHRDGFRALAIQWGAVGDVGLLEDLQKEQNEIEIGGTLQQKIGNCLQVLDELLTRHSTPIVSSMVVAEKFYKKASDSPIEAVKTILAISDIKTVSPHATFTELGMDSMMAVEIRQTLERDFDIALTPNDLRTLTFTTLQNLSMGQELESPKSIINEELLDLLVPKMQSNNAELSTFVDFNVEASKEVGDFILVFLGIDADFNTYDKMSQKINRHLKCVNIDAITKEYERTDIIAEHVLKAISNEIMVNKCVQICSHSIGCLPALAAVKRFEEIQVHVQIVFIDSSPKWVTNMLNALSAGSDEVFHYNLLLNIISRALPSINASELKNLLLKGNDFQEKVDICIQHYTAIDRTVKDNIRAMAIDFMAKLMSARKYNHDYSSKLKADVTLYKPTMKPLHDISDDYDLHTIFEQVPKIHVFNGNHQSMLENDELLKQLSIDLFH